MRRFLSILLAIMFILNSISFVSATENTPSNESESDYYIL